MMTAAPEFNKLPSHRFPSNPAKHSHLPFTHSPREPHCWFDSQSKIVILKEIFWIQQNMFYCAEGKGILKSLPRHWGPKVSAGQVHTPYSAVIRCTFPSHWSFLPIRYTHLLNIESIYSKNKINMYYLA